jgi:glycosyltransferase involved in cell wall biosynthesis
MNPKIYFLSRTSDQKVGGGLIRFAQAKYFRENGFRVIMVLPNYNDNQIIIDNDMIYVPIKMPIRMGLIFEHIGIIEDYLFEWSKRVIHILKKIVSTEDILFASSGGELTMLRIASEIKKITFCRYIANLHDPIVYTTVNGEWVGRKLHVPLDKLEKRFLSNADLVITSTRSYAESLYRKYPELEKRVDCMYFGYISKIKLTKKRIDDCLVIVYGGTFQKTQSPELLAETTHGMQGVNTVYIGNHSSYKPLDRFRKNVKTLSSMSQVDYNNYLQDNVDVGFVSLYNKIHRYCIPSKIFEYINAGIPIIGALPKGEAFDIINGLGFGIAVEFNDKEGLKNAINEMKKRESWDYYRSNVLRERDKWHLNSRMSIELNRIVGIKHDIQEVNMY